VGSGSCEGKGPPFGRTSSILARFRPDGRLDKSFADDGLAVEPDDHATSVAIGPTGRIVVAGFNIKANYEIVLLRYRRDGSLDPAFGKHGRVDTDLFPDQSGGVDVALTPRGRIIVGAELGRCDKLGCTHRLELARFKANGEPDASFGTDGVVNGGNSPGDPAVSAIALDSSRRIVTVGGGNTGLGGEPYNTFAVERFLPNGALDSGFGTGGAVTTAFGSCAVARASSVIIDGSDDLVVGGVCLPPSGSYKAVLTRYTPDGTLDSGFGSGGTAMTQFAFGNATFDGLATGPADEITAGGTAVNSTSKSALLLARYDSAGALDTGFGSGGTVTTPLRRR
jgi:uncharacterized delta-60 repeat protein